MVFKGLRPILLGVSLVISLQSPTALAVDVIQPRTSDPNVVELGSEIAIRLPMLPNDPGLRLVFESLSPAEQRSFYFKRHFLIEKLAGGLTKKGVRSGIRWVKNKIYRLKNGSPFIEPSRELEIAWENLPTDLSSENQLHVESTITALVDNMWANSIEIAKANGIGFTFVGGAIWNTSLRPFGAVWGRSLSADIGVDFRTQTGYVRVMKDSQALKQAGLSFDIGLMADVLVHLTDPDLEVGQSIEATHVKLPMIGCFRGGSNYKAWGAQMGYHVAEMVGTVLMFVGEPALGTAIIGATRGVGMATVYSTTLDRKILNVKRIPEEKMRALPLMNKFFALAEALKQVDLEDSADPEACSKALEQIPTNE